MRASLPAGRPRGAQDRGHVKPLQQGSGMGHTQVPYTDTPTQCIPKPPQTVPEAFAAWSHALPGVCG